MSFNIDKQTLSDLELFSPGGKNQSVFSFYNRVSTPGGQDLLYRIISSPMCDRAFLENRKEEIRFFAGLNLFLKLKKRQVDFIEYYLACKRAPLKNNLIDAAWDRLNNALRATNEYYAIGEGILHLTALTGDLLVFLEGIGNASPPASLAASFDAVVETCRHKTLSAFREIVPADYRKLKARQMNQLDHFFRDSHQEEIRKMLDTVYEIDVLQIFAGLLKEPEFSLPEYSPPDNPVFEVSDAVHPLLENPVSNSVLLQPQNPLCFITGPNMSGKSTFLKTIGLLTYLAHLGIPVPARKLKIPLLNGLFTTINLSDSLSQGFSHFYAEVGRVREMALSIRDHGKLVVVLDELFRGTNVKDAYEGTLLVVNALSQIRGAYFFISTHIVEVAEHLARAEGISFRCFESVLVRNKPVYDYQLKEGVTRERVGMQIIRNEQIETILAEIINKQS